MAEITAEICQTIIKGPMALWTPTEKVLAQTLIDHEAQVAAQQAEIRRLQTILKRCDPVTAALANGDYTPEMIAMEQEHQQTRREGERA